MPASTRAQSCIGMNNNPQWRVALLYPTRAAEIAKDGLRVAPNEAALPGSPDRGRAPA